jgi:hypothetical protein
MEEGDFLSLDDAWRATYTLASCHQFRLNFGEAHELWESLVEMCAHEEAPADEAAARVWLSQCKLALGDNVGAAHQAKAAVTRAAGQSKQLVGRTKSNLATLSLALADTEGALEVVKRAAIEAAQEDDYVTYIRTVAIVIHILRISQRHLEAYRHLVEIYGILLAKFGSAATDPIQSLIAMIQQDVGDEVFEQMGRTLYAERLGKK